jgi:hypothetical protein
MIEVFPVPLVTLGAMWPSVAPLLMRGLAATDEKLEDVVVDLLTFKTQLWIVLDDTDLVGVFLSRIIDEDGEKYVDVFGLAGDRLLGWGKTISNVMAAYAKSKHCKRYVFCGRKGLLRAYEGVRIVGEHSPGVYRYERAVT